jgi:hypothetical protein
MPRTLPACGRNAALIERRGSGPQARFPGPPIARAMVEARVLYGLAQPSLAGCYAASPNRSRTSPVTVRDVWVIASRTVFAWAIGKKLISSNPFSPWPPIR